MPGSMLVEHGGTLLLQFDAEHFSRLRGMREGVIAGWEKVGHIPQDDEGVPVGELLGEEQGVAIWLGKKSDAYDSDNDPRHILETPRVWLDTASAQGWVKMADGDLDAAARMVNEYVKHDADVNDPDCDERDPDTGFTCTLAEGHDGSTHVAGLGRACIAHVFTVEA